MTPELQILIINALVLSFAYFLIYPSMKEKTLTGMVRRNIVFTALTSGTAAILFDGTGTTFRLMFFETNWFVYWLISLLAMEAPLMIWYFRRYDVDMGEDDE